MDLVRGAITNDEHGNVLISKDNVKLIYDIINSMHPLHGTGFDLFGAVYEMFATSKEKKDFGEYFTRRHYAHIFAKLLLKDEDCFNESNKPSIIDPACGTGGFLTESFKVLLNQYKKAGTLSEKAKDFLSKECFYGVDVRAENIFRTKLNMFLVGDGHTNMQDDNTLHPEKPRGQSILSKTFRYVITNPPYGPGTIKAETNAISSSRTEIAFLCRVISLLDVGGKACVIIPDGILENPSYKKLRQELLEKCEIYGIVSLPKFAFAPYTKEKTYALFFKKKATQNTKTQTTPIWMYIIDNDGLANSDKRFPTKLRNNRNGWMHDEISGWADTLGTEQPGVLETRWLTFDDSEQRTSWIDEKGIEQSYRKGGKIAIDKITSDLYFTLLPEYYLRPYIPHFVTESELQQEISQIEEKLKGILK